MRQLIVRFLNVAVIAAVLIGYNTVLDKRDKEDQIARLSAELETTQLQKENLQAAAAASNTADTAASEAAEAEGQYDVLQAQDRVKQVIYGLRFNFFVHPTNSFTFLMEWTPFVHMFLF